jgi:hypothetical protein
VKDVLLLQQVPEQVNGKSYKLMPHEATERWPSAAARDQHPSRTDQNYLRNMLSRRQLQGFVRQPARINEAS